MANKKASKKDIRRSIKNRIRNRMLTSRMRTAIKKLYNFIKANETQNAEEFFPTVMSIINKASKVDLIKKENGSRKISRMHRFLKVNGCFK